MHVDQRAVGLPRENRGERLSDPHGTEDVGFEHFSHGVDVGSQDGQRPVGARVVDDDGHIVGDFGCRSHRVRVGDIESHRHDPGIA